MAITVPVSRGRRSRDPPRSLLIEVDRWRILGGSLCESAQTQTHPPFHFIFIF